MQTVTALFKVILASLMMGLFSLSLHAASPFSVAVRVNNALVTHYDVEQRANLLELINQPSGYDAAVTSMIDDVLRRKAALDAGMRLPDGMSDELLQRFLSSTPMSPEEALDRARAAGVASETIRRFVETQFLWEQLMRQRFSRQLALLRQDNNAAALAPRGFMEVNLSEIAFPLLPGEEQDLIDLANELRAENSREQFALNARQFSASATRDKDGALGWMREETLIPVIREAIEGLAIGQVSEPIVLPQAVILIRYNGKRENVAPPPRVLSVDTLQFSHGTPEIQSQVAQVIQRCDDIYGLVHEFEGLSYQFDSRAPSDLPLLTRRAVESLDENEVATLPNGQSLMLCARIYDAEVSDADADVSKDMEALLNRRLNALADGYLAELRADALISR